MNQVVEFIKLGETYIKLDFEYSDKNKQLLRQILEKQIAAYPLAEKFSESELKISIDFDKGSLKTKIGLWATVICVGVSNYGSFRSGIREIVNDANQFSAYIIENIITTSSIKSTDIIRTEKRTGLMGRLQELYQRIGRLERDVNKLSVNDFQHELHDIKEEVSNLISIMPQSDKELFLADLDKQYKNDLPKPNQQRVAYLVSRYGLKADDDILLLDE